MLILAFEPNSAYTVLRFYGFVWSEIHAENKYVHT